MIFQVPYRAPYIVLKKKRQLAARHLWRHSLWIIIIVFVSLLSATMVAADTTQDKSSPGSENDEQPESIFTGPAPPVQIGPGGSITLETKEVTELESLFEWHTHFLWESRYVSEGRDNLSGDSIVSVSSDFIVGDISFIPWYAISPDTDYRELNLNFVYGIRPTENLAVYFDYTHLRAHYRSEHAHDNEVSLGLVYKLLEKVGIAAATYHSFEADGAFMEVSAKYFDKTSDDINYSLQGGLGINTGYVADGHKGLNHLELRANVSHAPFIQAELYAYTAYNVALNKDVDKYTGDELLGDFVWAGIGFTYLF